MPRGFFGSLWAQLSALQSGAFKRNTLTGLLLAVFVLGMTSIMMVFAIAVLSLQLNQERSICCEYAKKAAQQK